LLERDVFWESDVLAISPALIAEVRASCVCLLNTRVCTSDDVSSEMMVDRDVLIMYQPESEDNGELEDEAEKSQHLQENDRRMRRWPEYDDSWIK
jgi:hypothetical protein